MKYVDASAVLRLVFSEPGPSFSPEAGDTVVSSLIVEVEAFRALDRERLVGRLDDAEVALKRKQLMELLAMVDLLAIDHSVIDRAKQSFAVTLRAVDAIHVATAEILQAEWKESLEFWTHDERQRIAALSRGLTVRG